MSRKFSLGCGSNVLSVPVCVRGVILSPPTLSLTLSPSLSLPNSEPAPYISRTHSPSLHIIYLDICILWVFGVSVCPGIGKVVLSDASVVQYYGVGRQARVTACNQLVLSGVCVVQSGAGVEFRWGSLYARQSLTWRGTLGVISNRRILVVPEASGTLTSRGTTDQWDDGCVAEDAVLWSSDAEVLRVALTSSMTASTLTENGDDGESLADTAAPTFSDISGAAGSAGPSGDSEPALSKAQRRAFRLLALDQLVSSTMSELDRVAALWPPERLFAPASGIASDTGTNSEADSGWQWVDVSFNPWPSGDVGVTPLWDRTIWRHGLEATSGVTAFSPYTPVFADAARVPLTSSTLNAAAIGSLLAGHPHGDFCRNGAAFGFGLMSSMAPCLVTESGSEREFIPSEADQIGAWIDKQVAAAKLVDVTVAVPTLSALFLSPFAAAPKTGAAPGEIRVCHDMSFASASQPSMNSSICFEPLCPIDLATVEAVVRRWRFLRTKFPNEQLVGSRLDMSAYFRQVGIRRRDFWRTGQRWRGRTYLHSVLSFGSKSAPHITSLLSNTVSDLMSERGWFAPCFLDDFILIGTREMVAAAIVELRDIFRQFGLQENIDKFIAPTVVLPVLGVVLDFVQRRAWVTDERRDILRSEITGIIDAGRKVTLASLQRLSGRLTFVSAVIPWGRCHTAALWAVLSDHTNQPARHHVTVNAELRSALRWWHDVLGGQRLVVDTIDVGVSPARPLHVVVGIRTDASLHGFGGVSLAHRLFVRGTWDETERVGWSINPRECIVPLFLLAALASEGLLGGCVVVTQIDNSCSVCAITKQHSRSCALRVIVRALALLQERFRFVVIPRHIPGCANGESDGLSRSVDPSHCLPNAGSGWRELRIPPSVRQVGQLARWPSHSEGNPAASLRCQASTIFFDSVLSDLSELPPERLMTPVPWFPYMCLFPGDLVSHR